MAALNDLSAKIYEYLRSKSGEEDIRVDEELWVAVGINPWPIDRESLYADMLSVIKKSYLLIS